ncbi:hypothetical protein [Herbaspirillum huttiense]|uniref:hypothetical protein n=1 Tax=Herbaspirillum huttiense TaxID=863372 RepID=UPI0039B0F59C
MNQSSTVAQGIEVDVGNIPAEGLPILYRRGEAFGKLIEWSEPEAGTLFPDSDSGTTGLAVSVDVDGRTECYAGWAARSKIWWRYADDALPGSAGEHCMQILEVLRAPLAKEVSEHDDLKRRFIEAIRDLVATPSAPLNLEEQVGDLLNILDKLNPPPPEELSDPAARQVRFEKLLKRIRAELDARAQLESSGPWVRVDL